METRARRRCGEKARTEGWRSHLVKEAGSLEEAAVGIQVREGGALGRGRRGETGQNQQSENCSGITLCRSDGPARGRGGNTVAAWVATQETITEPCSSRGTKGNDKVERAPLVKCRIVWQSNEERVSIY